MSVRWMFYCAGSGDDAQWQGTAIFCEMAGVLRLRRPSVCIVQRARPFCVACRGFLVSIQSASLALFPGRAA